jgi:hypothetical protein
MRVWGEKGRVGRYRCVVDGAPEGECGMIKVI